MILKTLKDFEKFFGSLKFAVVMISVFTVVLIIGTFVESYYGAEFAGKFVYKSLPFMFLQLCLFLSIFCATLLRLPPKKRLYGFYMLHSGLLILFLGSFITFYSGIDGSMTLVPSTPTRNISLPEDVLTVSFGMKRHVSLKLPNTALKTNLNHNVEGIELGEYLPFAGHEVVWKDSKSPIKYSSGEYQIFNNQVSQEFTMSLHPKATDFESSTQMGPLSVHFLPSTLLRCFGLNSKSGVIIWDAKRGACTTPEEKGLEMQATKSKNRYFAFKEEGKIYTFFPDMTPWPLDEKFTIISKSQYRVFGLGLFRDSPHLFLFGKSLAYYSDEKWVIQDFKKSGDSIELPWMGFNLVLKTHHDEKYPYKNPVYQLPLQNGGKAIQGTERALSIKVMGQTYWVKDRAPVTIPFNGEQVVIRLHKKSIRTPFEINLTRFKMDTNPGTMTPASFESFVDLFDGTSSKAHHLFMNNPLDYRNFTFYQASYFQLGQGQGYGSVLSVNYDPGRPWKYLGSLLLVLGSTWHFYLQKKKKKGPKNKAKAQRASVTKEGITHA